ADTSTRLSSSANLKCGLFFSLAATAFSEPCATSIRWILLWPSLRALPAPLALRILANSATVRPAFGSTMMRPCAKSSDCAAKAGAARVAMAVAIAAEKVVMVFMVRVPVFKKIKNEDCPPVYAGRRLHHNPHGRINAHGEGILLS